LIKALLASGRVGVEDIAIGAPTGKAAVRITEAMTLAGLRGIKARTWHSLLGVGEDEEGNMGFRHHSGDPWSFRVIFGDEESMKDMPLMCAVFAARPRSCHFLLVGDIYQLPPVGNGAPLRDMISSGIAGYGELTEIQRNSGGIVEACAAIRSGKPWQVGGNLELLSSGTPDQQLQAILGKLSILAASGFDPVWECQVVVAVNAKSKASRKYVNHILQQVLNKNEVVKGSLFRLNDKVVCLENGDYTAIAADSEARQESTKDGQVRVANGEVGRVVEIEPKSYVIELQTPDRTIRVPRGKSEASEEGDEDEEKQASSAGCKWDLAYALSCHKSQGSEWPYVFVVLDDSYGAQRVCSREWLYTAISRAKAKCYLVGKKSTADAMCGRVALGKRKTFLRELIQLANAERELELIL
jgi:exodeoxyribonuclease V alpha subunit